MNHEGQIRNQLEILAHFTGQTMSGDLELMATGYDSSLESLPWQ